MPLGRGSARRAERDRPLLRPRQRRSRTPSASRERLDVDRMHAAWDGDRIVGGAGAFTYRMSVPGGADPDRRGDASSAFCRRIAAAACSPALMRDQLEDCRARGEAAAYLWASEATIYPRFGYGLASLTGRDEAGRASTPRSRSRSSRAARCVSSTSTRRRGRSRRSTSRCSRSVPGCSRGRTRGGRGAGSSPSPFGAADREAARPARARRRAGGVRDLHREPGLGARVVGRQGDRRRGGRTDARRRRASCGAGCSTSTGRPSSRPACCRSTIRCSCSSPSRGACGSRSATASGCG